MNNILRAETFGLLLRSSIAEGIALRMAKDATLARQEVIRAYRSASPNSRAVEVLCDLLGKLEDAHSADTKPELISVMHVLQEEYDGPVCRRDGDTDSDASPDPELLKLAAKEVFLLLKTLGFQPKLVRRCTVGFLMYEGLEMLIAPMPG